MKVLICPLDWGLGHATRCIPLIRALQANGHEVMVGAAGGGFRLLASEFPELKIFNFPGYRVRYSQSSTWFLPVMLFQLPALILGFFSEGGTLKGILAEYKPDLIISDGRYGVFTQKIPCIFITHQIFIRVPGHFPGIGWVEKMILFLNIKLLRRFREVWVPDYPGAKNLSGDLSHGRTNLKHLVFIHPLSRFARLDGLKKGSPGIGELSFPIDILAMVSGPEPQRRFFELALKEELQKLPGTHILIKGLPENRSLSQSQVQEQAQGTMPGKTLSLVPNQLNEFNHLTGQDLAPLLFKAKLIVARTGYTTVMELASIGVKSAILVPTPGQSEQEYLAKHLQESGLYLSMRQEAINLTQVGALLQNYSGFDPGVNAFSLIDFIAKHPLFEA